MPISQANFIRMNDDEAPILVAQTNKNYSGSTQNFTTAEADALAARAGDLVILIYYGNASISNSRPTLNKQGGQSWTVHNTELLSDANAQIEFRLWWTTFNGTWTTQSGDAGPIIFGDTITSDAQGAGILVYRFGDSNTRIFTESPQFSTRAGGSGAVTTRNGWATTAGSDVTLSKSLATGSDRFSYLYFLLVGAGSNSSTTVITMNIVTNGGWTLDAEWTYANSGYTRVRIYTIKRSSNFDSSASIPSFVFDRTNGAGHGLVATQFFSNQYSLEEGLLEYTIVAGGGSGGFIQPGTGGVASGGGGGGGVLQDKITFDKNTTYEIVVGAGGNDSNGGNSTAFGLTAIGGGRGGGFGAGSVYIAPNSGGSGGGALNQVTTSGGAGTDGQGFKGGDAIGANTSTSGGGGGASAEGRPNSERPNGGTGVASIVNGTIYGQGGGGGSTGTAGLGGSGAGAGGTNANGSNGTANRGGGGGGASSTSGLTVTGGLGGSGIVLIRYLGPQVMQGGTVATVQIDGKIYTRHTFTANGQFKP